MAGGLSAIDLFAGGGALSVGLKTAGFNVIGAVEIEKSAYDTYVANHPEVKAYLQDIRTIKGKDLMVRHESAEGVALISGCPPCQGFSSLTSKWKKRDPRNSLIREMLRLVKEVSPQAVMMENVPGLATRGKRYLAEFVRELRKLGYMPQFAVVQAADYGVPQFRKRLVLLAGKGFEIPIPDPTHSRTGENELPAWITVRTAISGMAKPMLFTQARKRGGALAVGWHVVRQLSPENMKRIRRARPGRNWKSIPERLRPACHQGEYVGFGNVYGRMRWGEVSPTITGGCTTLSKGRFGHPSANRTISLKEAALLQTFPNDYIFNTPFMDAACDIVGNALPCKLAEALASQCIRYLKENKTTKAKRSTNRRRAKRRK